MVIFMLMKTVYEDKSDVKKIEGIYLERLMGRYLMRERYSEGTHDLPFFIPGTRPANLRHETSNGLHHKAAHLTCGPTWFWGTNIYTSMRWMWTMEIELPSYEMQLLKPWKPRVFGRLSLCCWVMNSCMDLRCPKFGWWRSGRDPMH